MKVSCELWNEIKELSGCPGHGVFCMVCQKEVDKPGHEYVSKDMKTGKETKWRGEDCLLVTFDGKRMGVIHSRRECRQRAQENWGPAPGWKSVTRLKWLRG